MKIGNTKRLLSALMILPSVRILLISCARKRGRVVVEFELDKTRVYLVLDPLTRVEACIFSGSQTKGNSVYMSSEKRS
jgi:hypothetical protein